MLRLFNLQNMTKTELFLQLANPGKNWISRWVSINEFIWKYKDLQLWNWWSWCRKSSTLAKKYIVEFDKSKTSWNSIDAIRLNWFNIETTFNHNIRQDIKDFYKRENCVMLGINGKSENTKIEIDHKDGRKNDKRISDLETQRIEDFQPLCKAANDIKRQICKKCRETNKRWNAKNIKWNPYEFYEWDDDYTEELGCKGCYQYDPVEYRKTSIKKISNEASDFIMKKLFPNE